MSSPPPFPPIPSSHHRFAWHGLALSLPSDLNLALHEGPPAGHRGCLIFKDLYEVRFAIRWQSPRLASPRARLHKILPRLRTRIRHAPEPFAPDCFRLHHDADTFAFLATNTRLFELHWPSTPPQDTDALLADFLTCQSLIAANPAAPWLWSVYGATGYLPRHARLTNASLLPGQTRLTFRLPHLLPFLRPIVILAAHSLADRLLAKQSLDQFAASLLKQWGGSGKRGVASGGGAKWGGAWQKSKSAPDTILFTQPARPPRTFSIHLDPASNLIRWSYSDTPLITPSPEPNR